MKWSRVEFENIRASHICFLCQNFVYLRNRKRDDNQINKSYNSSLCVCVCMCVCLSVCPHHSVSGWLSMSGVVWWFLGRGWIGDWGGCETAAKVQIGKRQMEERGSGREGRRQAGWWLFRNVLGCTRALRAKWNRLQSCHNEWHAHCYARLSSFSASVLFHFERLSVY